MKEFFSNHLGDVIYIASVVLLSFLFLKISRMLISRYINRSANNLNSDPTKFNFLKNSISVLVVMIALVLIIYRLPGGKTLAVSIFASAGIFAAIIGFASQAAFSNIVSGIFIVVFKPFRVGDLIRIGVTTTGTVVDITLRHTVIRDFENRRIIIPNSVISQETVVNSTIEDPKICRHIEFGISYDSDLSLAKEILREEAEKHPNCVDNRTPEEKTEGVPIVMVRVIGFGESAVLLRAYVWSANSANSWVLFTDVCESVKASFDAKGIEIPYPHRAVVLKGKTPLV